MHERHRGSRGILLWDAAMRNDPCDGEDGAEYERTRFPHEFVQDRPEFMCGHDPRCITSAEHSEKMDALFAELAELRRGAVY